MFVRQVKAHFKPGKFDLFNRRFEDEVVPLLKKQKGFRDELSFFDKKTDEAISMSFWDTQKDAELFDKKVYPEIHKKMANTLVDKPEVRMFKVNNSTWYNIHAA